MVQEINMISGAATQPSWTKILPVALEQHFKPFERVQAATLNRIIEENNILRNTPNAPLGYQSIYYKNKNSSGRFSQIHPSLIPQMKDYIHGNKQAELDMIFLKQTLAKFSFSIVQGYHVAEHGPAVFWDMIHESFRQDLPNISPGLRSQMREQIEIFRAGSIEWPRSLGKDAERVTDLLHLYNSYKLLAS